MGRCIFFPAIYRPPFETYKKLLWYQEQYDLYHTELNYQIKEMKLNTYQEMVYRQNSHNNVRKTWKLIDGFKEVDKAS